MRIVFLSNYFNHHQKPLSDALYRLTDDFLFVETSQMSAERERLGYHHPDAPYLTELDPKRPDAAVRRMIEKADVVIIGSAPNHLIRNRLRQCQLTFRFSERLFKVKCSRLGRRLRIFKQKQRNPQNKELYLLSAGAYAAGDYASCGLFKNRSFRWGYLPQTKRYPDIAEMVKRKKPGSLLWVGRFLAWKHPEMPVMAVRALRSRGYDCTLDMIGTGAAEDEIRRLVHKYELEDRVRLLGSVPSEEVRTYMEQAAIFVCTSDRQEGWGAVVNEAMNSGCAVIASHEVGSVPYLISDGINGMVFESGNREMLEEKIMYFLDHSDERERMSCAAYRTVTELWNSDVAAERFVQLSEALLHGDRVEDMFEDGPCSKAEVLSDLWKDRC